VIKANKGIILLISTVTAFILPFLMASVNVALPAIGDFFHMEAVTMSWVTTAYFLAIAMVQVPFGRLSDIFGHRRLFVMSLVLCALASFLGGYATSVPMLIASRVTQGVGAGVTYNNSIAILTAVFPSTERGKAIGISQAGTYLGLSLGPLIGGLMTEHLGWQSLFLLSGALGIFLVILVFFGLRAEFREASGEKFDVTGSVTYSIAIALFMYGFSSLPSITGIILLIIGTAGLVFFFRWETQAPSPILDISLFRENRVFVFSNLAVMITYLSTFAVNFLLSLYLQYIKGYSPETAGLVLIAASVFMTVFTLFSGFIIHKVEPRLVAATGMIFDCAALIMLIFLGNSSAIWYVILALAVYGIGIGLFVSPNTTAIMGSVETRMLGVASGTLGTIRTAGMMLSMGIVMILFSLYIGQVEITQAYYPQFLSSVRVGFIIFAALGAGGVIAQLMAREPSKEA
jgi:EmrB/QacA subfamily drug resistance transporter